MITCTFEDGGKGNLRHVTVTAFTVNKERTKYLLAQRSGNYSEPFKWGPPGGYVARDESVAKAALREAKEEVGATIRILNLIRINDQPTRPKEDRQNLDFLYLCEMVEEGEIDTQEVVSMKWVEIPTTPPAEEMAFDHFDNIRLCLAYLEKPFSAPIIGKISAEIFEPMY